MKITRRQLKQIIVENLLLEEVFSAAATGFGWNAVRGMSGVVTTHGRSLLSATQAFAGNSGTLASDFAARAGSRSVMNHNMKSLTSCINRMTSNPAARQQIFRLLQRGMGQAGRQYAWQGAQMVYVSSAPEVAIAFGSGITATSAAIFLGAIAAAMVVPAIAIHEFATMGILDKRLRNLYRKTGEVGNMKPVKPFSDRLLDVNSKPGKELTAVLPLIFQGFGKGENAILRQKARAPIGKIGEQDPIEAKPEALEMGNKLIELINEGIVDKNDLSNRYYKAFILPIIEEQKKAKEAIAELPDVSEVTQGDPPDLSVKDIKNQSTETGDQARERQDSGTRSGWDKYIENSSDKVNAKKIKDNWQEFSNINGVDASSDYAGFVKWYKSTRQDGDLMKIINKKAGDNFNPEEAFKLMQKIGEASGINESLSRGSLIRKRYWGRY